MWGRSQDGRFIQAWRIALKESGQPVGCIHLMLGKASNIGLTDSEGEIGYWIGVPYWGQGLIPEAVREMLRYGFEVLGLDRIWCGYFDGNKKSKRVQEKSGFHYHHTTEMQARLSRKGAPSRTACTLSKIGTATQLRYRWKPSLRKSSVLNMEPPGPAIRTTRIQTSP